MPESREVFELQGLEKYLLEQNLLEKRMEGANLDELLAVVRATGELPHGAVGQCIYTRLTGGVDRFVRKTRDFMKGDLLDPLEITLALGDIHLTGRIRGLYRERLLHYRYAGVKPKDRLRIWVRHLVLNTAADEGYPRESLLVGLEPREKGEVHWAGWRYGPVNGSAEILKKLAFRYLEGLVRPLPFFPEASWVFAEETLEKGRSYEQGLARARETWEGGTHSRGEREDAYFDLCFREGDALGPPFAELAQEIFGPLMSYQEKTK